jgi:hypothetical protein
MNGISADSDNLGDRPRADETHGGKGGEGGEARALNRMLITLGKERPHLLQQALDMPALTAIKEKAMADVAQMLDEAVFTEKATLNLMYDEQRAISTRQIAMICDQMNYIELPDDDHRERAVTNVGRCASVPSAPHTRGFLFDRNHRMSASD